MYTSTRVFTNVHAYCSIQLQGNSVYMGAAENFPRVGASPKKANTPPPSQGEKRPLT